LGIGIDTRPFAKSTLQLFRAQLVIHEEAQTIFRRSLEYAKGLGYLRGRRMRAALDSTHIFGRGTVEDTYNLLAEGIRLLSREMAKCCGERWEQWLAEHELARYAAPSIKGAAEVEWDDAASREAFLTGLIEDGARVLEMARQVRSQLAGECEADGALVQAAELLTQLLWQDVEGARGTLPDQERDGEGSHPLGARPGAAPRAQESWQELHGPQGGGGGRCREPVDHRGGGGGWECQRCRECGATGGGE
jgi:hypothetical protein